LSLLDSSDGDDGLTRTPSQVPSVPTEEARKLFPAGLRIVDLPSKKEYLRFTADPTVPAAGASDFDDDDAKTEVKLTPKHTT
jgi:hypothetical protein